MVCLAAAAVLPALACAEAGATGVGGLIQLTAPYDCIEQDSTLFSVGAEGCADTVGRGMFGASLLAVSPDGRDVYATSGESLTGLESNGLVELSRDPATGALTQFGCISETGAECDFKGEGLKGDEDIVVSPDGSTVYVGSPSAGIDVFTRAADGSLSLAECFKRTSDSGDPKCTTLPGTRRGARPRALAGRPVPVRGRAERQRDRHVRTDRGRQNRLHRLHIRGSQRWPARLRTHESGRPLRRHGPGRQPRRRTRLCSLLRRQRARHVQTHENRRAPVRELRELGCGQRLPGNESGRPREHVRTSSSAPTAAASTSSRWKAICRRSLPRPAARARSAAYPPGALIRRAQRRGRTSKAALDLVLAPPAAPGGGELYTVSFFARTVNAFSIDPSSGLPVALAGADACIQAATSTAGCAVLGHGLDSADGIAASPDGQNVYVASRGEDVVKCAATKCTDTIAAVASFLRAPVRPVPSGGGGGGGTPPPVPPPSPPTPPPSLGKPHLAPTTIHRKGHGPKSAVLTYTDTEVATTTVSVEVARTGVRKHGRCVKGRARTRSSRCAYESVLTTFTHKDAAGANAITVRTSIGHLRLALGRYLLVLVSSSPSGVSRPVSVTLRVV